MQEGEIVSIGRVMFGLELQTASGMCDAYVPATAYVLFFDSVKVEGSSSFYKKEKKEGRKTHQSPIS